jgi:hypothetical protein
MKKCKECGCNIPSQIIIDGKKRNLQNRKYCFKCSPFGEHNTRNLSPLKKGNKTQKYIRVCKDCGKEYNAAHRKGAKCHSCYFNKKQEMRSNKVYEMVGETCWLCGYNKGKLGRVLLHFHHINPKDKCFGLTIREMTGMSWYKVYEEMKKCALLCNRCHVEFHVGIIKEDIIFQVYEKNWKKISLSDSNSVG